MIVPWEEPRVSANSRVVSRGFASTRDKRASSSISTGRPSRGLSSSEVSPQRNLVNHLRHVRTVRASSPYAAHIFSVAVVASLRELNS